MAGEFLTQILILLAGSLLVLSAVRRFRLPPILGYLVVGMVLGPHSLGLVSNDESIRRLAEIGVVFLVFTLGLEFSLARMVAMKSEVLGVGGLQVLLCTLAFGAMAHASGIEAGPAIVIGGALAMSSTAIVLRQLGDQLGGTAAGRVRARDRAFEHPGRADVEIARLRQVDRVRPGLRPLRERAFERAELCRAAIARQAQRRRRGVALRDEVTGRRHGHCVGDASIARWRREVPWRASSSPRS